MRFFGKDLSPISMDDFIECYNSDYYLDGAPSPVRGLSRSSRFTENEIDRLLREGMKEERDVARILAWKLGKIRHRGSENAQAFQYAKDWSGAEELVGIFRYGKKFDLQKLADYIIENIDQLEQDAKHAPQLVLNELRGLNIAGLGTVYMITLLYFLSRGEHPIYDRFAAMALTAIEKGVKPSEAVDYKELPEKNSPAFSNILSEGSEYIEYKKQMKTIFVGKDLRCRDIDRALWVYGHLFKAK